VLKGVRQLQHRQLALAAADDVDPVPENHLRGVRGVRTADDDRHVELALDANGQLLNRMVNAGECRERDQPGIIFANRADEVWGVRDEQEVGFVAVGFQDA
jgi:hypothetical protein